MSDRPPAELREDPRASPDEEGSVGPLRSAFWVAIAQQVPVLCLSALLLDGGVVYRRVTIAMVAYWCFVAVFLVRRRDRPTNVDGLFIKYGIWPLIVVVNLAAQLLGRN